MVAVGKACGRNVEDRKIESEMGQGGRGSRDKNVSNIRSIRSVPAQVTTAWERRRRMRGREEATV
jgi:hypothetical protein